MLPDPLKSSSKRGMYLTTAVDQLCLQVVNSIVLLVITSEKSDVKFKAIPGTSLGLNFSQEIPL